MNILNLDIHLVVELCVRADIFFEKKSIIHLLKTLNRREEEKVLNSKLLVGTYN